jgi:hypothetical protein
MTLGWVTPLEITGNGYYTLGSSANVPQVYIIRQGFTDGEYLLIENRQPQGYDSQLQGGGIAVWHIDEGANDKRGYLGQEGWPRNGNRYKVTLLQADGDQDLERGANNGDVNDLWHKNSEFTVLGPSSPGKKVVEVDAYLVPNTDSFRHGNVTRSGIWIHNFTHLGEYMGFSVHGLTGNASAGYPSPNSAYAWVRSSYMRESPYFFLPFDAIVLTITCRVNVSTGISNPKCHILSYKPNIGAPYSQAHSSTHITTGNSVPDIASFLSILQHNRKPGNNHILLS